MKKLPKTLPEEQIIKKLNELGLCKKSVLVLLLYGVGLRVSEAINIKCGQVVGGFIQVRCGKGGWDRDAPMPAYVEGQLKEYIKQTGKGKDDLIMPINRKRAWQITQEVLSINPHALRHSYATHQIQHGIGLSYLQRALGHVALSSTERYIHVKNGETRDAVRKCHPLDRKEGE